MKGRSCDEIMTENLACPVAGKSRRIVLGERKITVLFTPTKIGAAQDVM